MCQSSIEPIFGFYVPALSKSGWKFIVNNCSIGLLRMALERMLEMLALGIKLKSVNFKSILFRSVGSLYLF